MLHFIGTSHSKEGLSPPEGGKGATKSTMKEGDIKCGQLQVIVTLPENAVTLEEAIMTIPSELRWFRLTKESIDCFQKDSQVHKELITQEKKPLMYLCTLSDGDRA